MTAQAIFEARFEKSPGCWLWKLSQIREGYGRFHYKGNHYVAHRFSYELYKGKIPPDKIVMHICDNPQCVNPAHLQLGTYADNMQDKLAKGRANSNYGVSLGEANGNSKLTNAAKTELLALRRGLSKGALAKQFGISYSQVARILRESTV